MAVKVRRRESGKVILLKVAASTTINKDRFVEVNASGEAIEATSTTAKLVYVANETKTSGASGTTLVNCTVLDESVDLEIDTSADTSQTLVGETHDLTNSGTCNIAWATTNVVLITGIIGAPSARKVTAIVTR